MYLYEAWRQGNKTAYLEFKKNVICHLLSLVKILICELVKINEISSRKI